MPSELSDFLRRPAPAAICRLPRAMWIPYPGSNLDFINRVALEAMDIVHQQRQEGFADSLVRQAPFTLENVCGAMTAYQYAARGLKDGFDDEAMAYLRGVPGAEGKNGLVSDLNAIALFYTEKAKLSRLRQIETTAWLDDEIARVERNLAKGDNFALLDDFSHAASLIASDGETPVPALKPGIVSLSRTHMAKALGNEIDRLNRIQDPTISLVAWLGVPDSILDARQDIASLMRDMERSEEVLSGIKSITAQLETILTPSAFTPAAPRMRAGQRGNIYLAVVNG